MGLVHVGILCVFSWIASQYGCWFGPIGSDLVKGWMVRSLLQMNTTVSESFTCGVAWSMVDVSKVTGAGH